jgi:hypothetical protein
MDAIDRILLPKYMGLAENWVPNNFIIDDHAPHHSLAVFRGPPPFFVFNT